MHLGLSVRFIDMQSTVCIKGSCVRLFYDKLVKAGVIHNENNLSFVGILKTSEIFSNSSI